MIGGDGGSRSPAYPSSSSRGQKAPADEFKQSDEQIELLSDISLGFSSDLARDFVLEQYKGTEGENKDVNQTTETTSIESCANSSHSSQDESSQDETCDGGAGPPVYSNSLNVFTTQTQSPTDQNIITNNHDNSVDSNGPKSLSQEALEHGDDPGNRDHKPPNDKPEKPKSDQEFPYYFIVSPKDLGFDINVKTSTHFRDELHKRYSMMFIDIKHALARPPDSFKKLMVELGYPQYAEDAEIDNLTPVMSFQCGSRETIIPRYSKPNALLKLKASVDSSVSRAMQNIEHFARRYRADYAMQFVFPIPMYATDALIRSRYERIKNIKTYVSNSLKRLEKDLKKQIDQLGLEIEINFEKFRSAVFNVLETVPMQFKIEIKEYNVHFENHLNALEICRELERVFEMMLLAPIRRECEKMVDEDLSILESPFVSQEEKSKIKPKVDAIFAKRDKLIDWLRYRFGYVRRNESEKAKYEYLPTRFLYRLYLQLRKINSTVYELEVIGRNVVHSFVRHLAELQYNGAELYVLYNIHTWSSSTLEPYLHAHILMLNVIETKDGRYIRVRPFFGAKLEKTKEPYKRVTRSLNKLIKLMDKLPNSLNLLAKLKAHKSLIFRADRSKSVTKEFNAILDEINRSETAIREAIDAYRASLSFDENMSFSNEIIQLEKLWTDVVAEWAEYIRVRAEAIREGLNVLQEAYKRALQENGIPVADVPKFEFKASEEMDEETNPTADSPKAPYIWSGYFKLDRRATLRHVLKYMSRRPIQDLALYCYEYGDYPNVPLSWLDQLINYKNQRCALGLAREDYALLDVLEQFGKFSDEFLALKNKFEKLMTEHPELNEKLIPLGEKMAEIEKYVLEAEEKTAEDNKSVEANLIAYTDLIGTLLESIEKFRVFEAEELKEKQNRLAELNKQKAEIDAIRFECENIKREIEQLEDWIKSGIEREGDREQLAELQKKRDELEQKLTELALNEQKIAQEMQEILKTLDVAKQTAELFEEISKARENVEEIGKELKEDKHYCPLCGRRTEKPRFLTTDMLTEKVEKGLVLYYVDPETRRARLCVSSKAPNAREVVSYFAIKSYTARAMLELEKSRYVDKVVSEWFVSEFSRSRGEKNADSR
jgi:hypothetical protein